MRRGNETGGQQRGRVENALTASGRENEPTWALPCRGIIGTPCIIACVPYTRCAVCDWIGGDGSREIADPNQGGRPTAGVYLGGPSSPSAAALPIYVTVDAWRRRSCVRTQGFSFNYRLTPSAFPPPDSHSVKFASDLGGRKYSPSRDRYKYLAFFLYFKIIRLKCVKFALGFRRRKVLIILRFYSINVTIIRRDYSSIKISYFRRHFCRHGSLGGVKLNFSSDVLSLFERD